MPIRPPPNLTRLLTGSIFALVRTRRKSQFLIGGIRVPVPHEFVIRSSPVLPHDGGMGRRTGVTLGTGYGMFENFGQRHPNLEFALVVLFGAVVGGFGLGALNYAIIEIATK
jgi:hypothetical protein